MGGGRERKNDNRFKKKKKRTRGKMDLRVILERDTRQ